MEGLPRAGSSSFLAMRGRDQYFISASVRFMDMSETPLMASPDLFSASVSPRDDLSPAARDVPPICKHLSSDYLNQYREVLRLIATAPGDDAAAAALAVWNSKSYRAYFGTSAPLAVAAYDFLPGRHLHLFERYVAEMDMLVEMACFALQPPCNTESARQLAETTTAALQPMISRAAMFLDSGGRDIGHPADIESAESVINRIRAIGCPAASGAPVPPAPTTAPTSGPPPVVVEDAPVVTGGAERAVPHRVIKLVKTFALLMLAAAAFLYGERLAEGAYPAANGMLGELTKDDGVVQTWCAQCRRGGSFDLAAVLAKAGREWIVIRRKLPVTCPYCGGSGNDT